MTKVTEKSVSPKRKILVIGSGPIQIGQACEFDYSGTQACLAFKDEGYEVVLVNDNPASILTDPETATITYLEPLIKETIARIALIENVWAVAPSFGGQVALNLYMALAKEGFWDAQGICTLGLTPETVNVTEDRKLFQNILKALKLEIVRGGFVKSVDEGLQKANALGYPVIVRASFTLGGAGGGFATNETELVAILEEGYRVSPLGELCIEESIKGWKEYELEVMRDSQGCFLVVCGVENVNPMGVHTGDSITVSPCMTLTDLEYQKLRDYARLIFDAVGLKIGGANIQFAVHPESGRIVVIEMNPRVSRSSALVSKATGYPIARIAARLAVGRSLMELRNEITIATSAFFEPAIDYVAVKIPLWDTHKFEGAHWELGIQMKSVGEVLAFGRTFRDAFEKAWQSLERGFEGWPDLPSFLAKHGLWRSQIKGSLVSERKQKAEVLTDSNAHFPADSNLTEEILEYFLQKPTPALFPAIKSAFILGYSIEKIQEITRISNFFLRQLKELVDLELALQKPNVHVDIKLLVKARQDGFTLDRMARLSNTHKSVLMQKLQKSNVGAAPTFRMVDTCAGEFAAQTPFYFKTFETQNETKRSDKQRIVVAGSGPNRIGQGVEFDTSCVHAIRAARNAGFSAIMVNSNPETVSTDFLTSDKLYMEPLTEEGILDILAAEQPYGVFVQFGGQSPLKLASAIKAAGYHILGTPLESIHLAEDRGQFGALMDELGIKVPAWTSCVSAEEGFEKGLALGFPLLVRPSFVLGGQAMEIVRTADSLKSALERALRSCKSLVGHEQDPVLIDCYLEGAREYDVDGICDGVETFVPAIMEHLEEAGIHSGDSTSVIPPIKLSAKSAAAIMEMTPKIAASLGVRGLLNIQFAVTAQDEVYVIEVNPRSSRSVPFVSKATGIPMAYLAARVAMGTTMSELKNEGVLNVRPAAPFCLKTAVFPFQKFPGILPALGPQMQSIGETMSLGKTFEECMTKSYAGKGQRIKDVKSLFIVASLEACSTMKNDLKELLGLSLNLFIDEATRAALQNLNLLAKDRQCVVLDNSKILNTFEEGTGAYLLAPTLVGNPNSAQRSLAHSLLRKALRKRIPHTNSCHAISGLIAALRCELNETNWTLVPINKEKQNDATRH